MPYAETVKRASAAWTAEAARRSAADRESRRIMLSAPLVDADGRPRLADRTLGRAAGAVQVAGGLDGDRARGREAGGGRHHGRERAVHRALDLLDVRLAHALHVDAREAMGAADHGQEED